MNGKPHGYGVCKFKSGKIYKGNFTNGLGNGYGTIIKFDGSKYEGSFKDGFPYGKGTAHACVPDVVPRRLEQ